MKVSIVVPVYNVEQYLEECLDSAVNQTLKDIEVIAVNDGSTDDGPQILKKYEEKYSNFKVVNKKNGGLSSARNVGLDVAQGEYIYFLDSDDYLLYKDIIEYCYNIAKDYNLDIITFDLKEFFDYGVTVIPASRSCSRKDKIESNTINGEEFFYTTHKKHVFDDYVPTVIYRTAYLRKNKLKFYEDRIYEDGIFNIQAFIKADRVLYVPYEFYFRRIRDNSITTKEMTEVNVYSLMKNVKSINDFYLDNINTLEKETKDSLAEVVTDYLKRIDSYSNTINIDQNKRRVLHQEIRDLKESLSLNLKEMGYMKVSIIITVKNKEKYLAQCLDSVVEQTLNGIEIIAINDDSTENCLNILKEYEEKYSNLKVINKENEDVGSEKNLGIDLATGEFIYFLDSDGYIKNNDIMEYCYNLGKDHALDIVTFDSIEMYDNENKLIREINTNNTRKDILESRAMSGKDFYDECIEKNIFKNDVWLNLYKRELLIKNNIRFKQGREGEEIKFNVSALVNAALVLYVPYEFHCRRVI